MSEELVKRLREPMTFGFSLKLGDLSAELQSQRDDAADLIERQAKIIEQIAMHQTGRTPEQALQYFQNLARALTNTGER